MNWLKNTWIFSLTTVVGVPAGILLLLFWVGLLENSRFIYRHETFVPYFEIFTSLVIVVAGFRTSRNRPIHGFGIAGLGFGMTWAGGGMLAYLLTNPMH